MAVVTATTSTLTVHLVHPVHLGGLPVVSDGWFFPIHDGFTHLEVSKADGVTVRYTN